MLHYEGHCPLVATLAYLVWQICVVCEDQSRAALFLVSILRSR